MRIQHVTARLLGRPVRHAELQELHAFQQDGVNTYWRQMRGTFVHARQLSTWVATRTQPVQACKAFLPHCPMKVMANDTVAAK